MLRKKHFFGRFFVPSVLFLLFLPPEITYFHSSLAFRRKTALKLGKIFVIFQSKVRVVGT